MKKIILFLSIIMLSFGSVFADAVSDAKSHLDAVTNAQSEVIKTRWENSEQAKSAQMALDNAKNEYDRLTNPARLDSPSFVIPTNSLIPWMNLDAGDTTDRANRLLARIIQNMMIALGAISILIMTIWAWYMILYSWDDWMLSKWKSIFMAGIYAMLASLGSYYMVALISYILYKEYV